MAVNRENGVGILVMRKDLFFSLLKIYTIRIVAKSNFKIRKELVAMFLFEFRSNSV